MQPTEIVCGKQPEGRAMTDGRELEDLIDRHLHGELDERDQERLAEWLDTDPAARKLFIQHVHWDTQLAEAVREGQASNPDGIKILSGTESPDDSRTRKTLSSGGTQLLGTLLALSLIVIAGLATVLIQERSTVLENLPGRPHVDPSIARITGLSGPMIWTGDRGELVGDIRVGTELAGGTIEGLSPDSWFELQFKDGSEVTISGASMLTFSDDGQKRLRLREGRMAADVTPQPQGQPMVIQTRTATLTVLGTSFDVEADLPATALSVREGTVRVTRTSDGHEIDVPANHRVIAAADQVMKSQPIERIVQHWRSRIDQGPGETYGKWVPASDANPAFLKAVAFVPEDNPSLLLYLVGLRVGNGEGAPVQVNSRSHFEIRGRIDTETDVYFGIQVADADGKFAGKFLAKCAVDRDSSGRFVATAELPNFGLDPSVAAYKDKLAPSPDGLFINGAWCFTQAEEPSGLRISQVNLRDTPLDQSGQ